jgi:hypothetical protein
MANSLAQPCHDGFRPRRLRSLSDMRPIYIAGLFSVVDSFSTQAALTENLEVTIDQESRDHLMEKLPLWYETLNSVGFISSVATLEKIVKLCENPESNWKEMSPLCEEFMGRIVDEAEKQQFFSLSLSELDWYTNPWRGWGTGIERFPQIVDDVEEASKCYALSRYAAAVFHSVQILEAGLIELGTFLKIQDPHSGWTAVSGALKKVIEKKHTERTSFEKKNFPFLEQMHGLVQGLKNAWRNKISHASGRLVLISSEFKPETAEEILMATRAFIRRLAEELPPSKAKKKGGKK